MIDCVMIEECLKVPQAAFYYFVPHNTCKDEGGKVLSADFTDTSLYKTIIVNNYQRAEVSVASKLGLKRPSKQSCGLEALTKVE